MVEQYLFFNSTFADRRRYGALDIAKYWRSFIKSGLIHTDGEPTLRVIADGENMKVDIEDGKAIIYGHLYAKNGDLSFTLSPSSATEDRYDRIVLRLDNRRGEDDSRFIRAFLKEGTGEDPPELERTFIGDTPIVYEISLAQIHVKAGKSFIDQTDIIDERLDEELCGLASSLVTVPLDEFNAQMEKMANEWNDWFSRQQTEGFVLQSEKGQPNGVAEYVKHNFNSDKAPTENDDISEGYSIGSLWIEKVTIHDGIYIFDLYICIDSKEGDAIWANYAHLEKDDEHLFYEYGFENDRITGGYSLVTGSGQSRGNYAFDKEDTHMKLSAHRTSGTDSWCQIMTEDKIDLSKIDKLYIEWSSIAGSTTTGSRQASLASVVLLRFLLRAKAAEGHRPFLRQYLAHLQIAYSGRNQPPKHRQLR